MLYVPPSIVELIRFQTGRCLPSTLGHLELHFTILTPYHSLSLPLTAVLPLLRYSPTPSHSLP